MKVPMRPYCFEQAQTGKQRQVYVRNHHCRHIQIYLAQTVQPVVRRIHVQLAEFLQIHSGKLAVGMYEYDVHDYSLVTLITSSTVVRPLRALSTPSWRIKRNLSEDMAYSWILIAGARSLIMSWIFLVIGKIS